MAKKDQISASVLAFDRRLSSSNAVFYGVQWDKRKQSSGRPLSVEEKSVRGVIDHRLKAAQATQTKVEAEIQNPNLQTVDYCALGLDEDTLRVHFNVQLAGKIAPCACNNPKMTEMIEQMLVKFSENNVFHQLCRRYVLNIANGRFLWRNRLGAEEIEVRITMDGSDAIFDALSITTQNFTDIDPETHTRVEHISQKMAQVLSGEKSHVNLAVDAWVKKFPGLEVYPSQELVTDGSRGKGRKSKHLFEVAVGDKRAAALHPQKVTNAIHTIDDWYEDAKHPISINAYGAVTSQGRAYREPGKTDFYTLFDRAVQPGLLTLPPDEQNYVVAMLIRGGVFSEKGE